MILIKTPSEIDKMRRAGKKLAILFELLEERIIKENSNAYEIERFVLSYMKENNSHPAFKGYGGYPYAACVSVNEEVIHGFPLKEKIFKKCDIVSVDIGLIYDGYIADAARSYIIGNCEDEKIKLLVEKTKESFFEGIKYAKPGFKIGDIGANIYEFLKKYGLDVVRDFVGHGVGRKLHEDPQIPNYGRRGTGPTIRKNMTFAIEPMVTLGNYQVEILEDGWTVVTVDRSLSAHYENTIVITDDEPEILTKV